MAKDLQESTTSSGTVARVALLLRVLAEADGPLGLSDVAARMALPPSTTHRLLALLAEQGFVERGAGGRTYGVGLEFFRIAGLVSSRAQVTEIAGGFMQAVVDGCDETCMLSLRDAGELDFMIAKVVYGSHPLRYEVALFRRSPLLWGAPGRGILAFLPDEVQQRALERERAQPARGKARPLARIPQELAQVRSQGYAMTRGQNVAGAVGLSAPVRDASGVIGALCVTIPESRFDEKALPRLTRLLKGQAAALSHALGAGPAQA